MVAMSHMFVDMLQPEIRLCRFDLVLASHLLAVAQLPAKMTQVQIDRFKGLEIDGVEAFYITHDEPQTRLLVERCNELGLLTTGSADYHGPDNKLFSRFLAFETYGLEPNLGLIASHA